MSVQDICNYHGIMTGRHIVTIPGRWKLSAHISLPTIATLNDLKGLLEEHESVTGVKVKMSGSLKQWRFTAKAKKKHGGERIRFPRHTVAFQVNNSLLSVVSPALRPSGETGSQQMHATVFTSCLHPPIPDRTCIQSSIMQPPAFTHMKERHTADHTDDISFSVRFCLDLWVVFLLKITRLSQAWFLPASLYSTKLLLKGFWP